MLLAIRLAEDLMLDTKFVAMDVRREWYGENRHCYNAVEHTLMDF